MNDTEPVVIAAPELLDRDMKVVRSPDDTDETYRSRCELFDLLIKTARRQAAER